MTTTDGAGRATGSATAESRWSAAHPNGRLVHNDDRPETLRILAALVGQRRDYDLLGYFPVAEGALVDWDALLHDAPLSSTQIAAAYIARGCATLERVGGLPTDLAQVVADVVRAVA